MLPSLACPGEACWTISRCLSSSPAQHISSSIHPRLARLVLGVTNCSAWLKGKPQTAATHTNTHAHASMAFNHTHTCTWGLVGTSNVSLHHAGSRFRRIPRGKVEAKHAPPRSQRTRLHTSMRVRAQGYFRCTKTHSAAWLNAASQAATHACLVNMLGARITSKLQHCRCVQPQPCLKLPACACCMPP